MKVMPCSNISYGKGFTHTNITKPKKVVTPKVLDTKEPDYGKSMKQLSYVIGVSMLGISSIVLGTRGKFCGLRF